MKVTQEDWNRIMENSEENPSVQVKKKKGAKTVYVYKAVEDTSPTKVVDPSLPPSSIQEY
jgi:hypothetical protein